jgi:hypothetical protein
VSRVDRVEQWLRAIVKHEPGAGDEAAEAVASWSADTVRTLWIDVNNLLALTRDAYIGRFDLRRPGQRTSQQIHYTAKELHRLRVLANYVLRRGALLHTDVAMRTATVMEPLSPPGGVGTERLRVTIGDGLGKDFGQNAVHWEIARSSATRRAGSRKTAGIA